MMHRSAIAWVSLGILMSACGCILGSGPEKTATEPAAAGATSAAAKPAEKSDARVGAQWQKDMLTKLESDPAGFSEAFGLFSEGGWADAGQVMVLVTADKKALKLNLVPANGKAIVGDRALTSPELKTIEAAAKTAQSLSDIDIESFDGLIFEYVHAIKTNGKATVDKRFFVRNPGVKAMPDHDKVINAFQELRKQK